MVSLLLASLLLGASLSGVSGTRASAATGLQQGSANWAVGKVGATNYRYLCLAFVYQAWQNAGMSRSTLDARSGYVANGESFPIDQWNYWMTVARPAGTLHIGSDAAPPVGAIIYYSNRLGRTSSHATISVGGGNQISPDTDKVNGPQSVSTNNYRTMLGWWLPDEDPGPSPIAPVGSLDAVDSPTPGQLHVAGWARDDNDPNAALAVHVYVGGPAGSGAPGAATTANVYRSDVGGHAYDLTLISPGFSVPSGDVQVCAYAINIGPPGDNIALGCKTVRIAPPNPTGSVMGILGGGYDRQVLVYGSASDPNQPDADIGVRALVGGHLGDPGAAVVELGTTGSNVGGQPHTFNRVFDARVGTYPVCVVAVNVGPGVDTELGCREITIKAPAAPSAPVQVSATAGDAAASLSWTNYSTGSAITSSSITASPGGKTWKIDGAATTATLSGLTNGTTYTFTVTSTNELGTGPASEPSNAVTPTAPAVSCPAPTGPTLGFTAGVALGAGSDPSIPVRGSWTGGDTRCSYVVQRLVQSNWSTVSNGPNTFVTLGLYPGALPALRVRSGDPAGGMSGPVNFPARTLDQLQDTQFTYTGRVSKSASSGFWGGTSTQLTAAGTTAEATILGDTIAIVGSRGPGYGAVKVIVDGKTLGTIGATYQITSHRQVLASYPLARGGSHTLKLVNVATAESSIFALDGVAVLSS